MWPSLTTTTEDWQVWHYQVQNGRVGTSPGSKRSRVGINAEDAEMKAERKALSLRHTGYLPTTVPKGRLAVHNRVNGNGRHACR